MRRNFLKHLAGAMIAGMLGTAWGQEHEAVKRPVDIPPSADLSYAIKARQKGISLNGEALVSWRMNGSSYSVSTDTRATLLGKILENHSEGMVDAYGLAPVQFSEKRFRKEPTSTTFDRAGKTISFSAGTQSYPIKGGEQDRASAQWQLVSVARAAPEKFTPGSEWSFFVAGRKDAEPWNFKVVKRETIRTGMGEVEAVLVSKAPPADSKDQHIDIWLAPAHEWYPVRLRFTDEDGEFVEQTLDKIAKK